jgi:hypothetical protein
VVEGTVERTASAGGHEAERVKGPIAMIRYDFFLSRPLRALDCRHEKSKNKYTKRYECDILRVYGGREALRPELAEHRRRRATANVTWNCFVYVAGGDSTHSGVHPLRFAIRLGPMRMGIQILRVDLPKLIDRLSLVNDALTGRDAHLSTTLTLLPGMSREPLSIIVYRLELSPSTLIEVLKGGDKGWGSTI